MYTTRLPYTIFEIDDTPEAHDHILAEAVAKINPRYFGANPRFKALGKLSSLELVDSLRVYEEGSRWDLVIIKVLTLDEQLKYLFLPLVGDIKSDAPTMISELVRLDLGDVAFGLETYAPFYGIRNWKMVDAFSDIGFLRKLIHLFLSWEPLEQSHPNAYVEIAETGVGKFLFHCVSQIEPDSVSASAILPQLTQTGNMALQYDDLYRLVIYSILPTAPDIASLQSAPNIAGWITYSRPQVPELLIGVLQNVKPS